MTIPREHYESEFFFLPASRGQIFASLSSPAPGRSCRGSVLCVMPLAEEMNRCRRLVAMQAKALAQDGLAVLCIDLYGCGDSEGEFADADWATWIADLRLARAWLTETSGCQPDIWAIRHGALLAAAAFSDALPRRILLWQPVVSGSAALVEMLRVSVASNMLSGSDKSMSVNTLKKNLLDGQTIEVGGYSLTPEFARALAAASLEPWPFSGAQVDWLEIAPDGGEKHAAQQALPPLAEPTAAPEVSRHRVPGRRFWSSPDVYENPELLSKTLQVFGR